MKRRISILIIITFLVIFNLQAFADNALGIPSDCSYILMDAKTGQVIIENKADEKLRPASTTKIMTALVALERGSLEQPMKVSEEAVLDIGPGGMNIGIMAGEEGFNLEHMLNVLLVKSANETANIISENIADSRESFIQMMNDKAVALGATNTNFVNPSGKDNKKEEQNHLSTARDMANIARYAMTLPKFREIVNKEYYKDLPATNKHSKWPDLRTTNKLLWPKNEYPYIIEDVEHKYVVNGIKTGYTNAAGNNLISCAVNEEGMELIAAVMHVMEVNNGKGVFTYTKELLKYGFERFSTQKVTDAGVLIKTVEVEDAKDNVKLDLMTATELSCPLPIDKSEHNITKKEYLPEKLKAPINKGEIIGSIEYERNGALLGKVNIVAGQAIEKSMAANIRDTTKKALSFSITKIILAILGLMVFLVVLRFVLRRISRSRKKNQFKL